MALPSYYNGDIFILQRILVWAEYKNIKIEDYSEMYNSDDKDGYQSVKISNMILNTEKRKKIIQYGHGFIRIIIWYSGKEKQMRKSNKIIALVLSIILTVSMSATVLLLPKQNRTKWDSFGTSARVLSTHRFMEV